MVHAYRGKTRDSMEPHVFMVAEESWTQMKQMQSDQSIIVSGESGAGSKCLVIIYRFWAHLVKKLSLQNTS